MIVLGLLAVLDGSSGVFFQGDRAVERLLGHLDCRARLVLVSVGLGEIARVDHRKLLPPLDAFAQLDLQIDQPAGDRRQYFDGARRLGFDDRWQLQYTVDLLLRDRTDGQLAAQRRAFRDHDPRAVSDQIWHALL